MTKPSLRDILTRPGILTLPGVYDGISARVANSLGFPALYMTGYGAVASALGVPDAGLASVTEMLDRVRCIGAAIDVPFIADGDTGYGGLLNVDRTVRAYAAAGAAGIQLEDQEIPKKCGHTEYRRVVPFADAVQKIRVAAGARPDPDFLIVARTDARYSEGLDEALRRGEAFLNAGADILFIESPESPEELRRIGAAFHGATLLANMVEGGRSPLSLEPGTRNPWLQGCPVPRHRIPDRGEGVARRICLSATEWHQHRWTGANPVLRNERADGIPCRPQLRSEMERPGLIHCDAADHTVPVMVGADQVILPLRRRDQQDPRGFTRLNHDIRSAVSQ